MDFSYSPQQLELRARAAALAADIMVHEEACEEGDGLPFQLPLPALVLLEDGFRAGAEGAVIEEVDVGIEEEEIAEAVSHHWRPRLGSAHHVADPW